MKSHIAIRGINDEAVTVKECDDGYVVYIESGANAAGASLRADQVSELVDQLTALLTPPPAELTEAQKE